MRRCRVDAKFKVFTSWVVAAAKSAGAQAFAFTRRGPKAILGKAFRGWEAWAKRCAASFKEAEERISWDADGLRRVVLDCWMVQVLRVTGEKLRDEAWKRVRKAQVQGAIIVFESGVRRALVRSFAVRSPSSLARKPC